MISLSSLLRQRSLEQVLGGIYGVEWMGNGRERYRVDGGTARDDFWAEFWDFGDGKVRQNARADFWRE
ncbi:hypothetical protein TB1_003249 [Malus domestica]